MSQTPKYKISLPDFGKHHFSKKEVIKLFENFELKNRNDLKYDSTDPSDYYELPDGRILLVLGFGNGSGTMYDSENEYKNIMSSSKGNLLEKNYWEGYIKNKKKFLAEIEFYVNSLADSVNLDRKKLDCTMQSLQLVDSAFNANLNASSLLEENFIYLIAYVGQVIKKEANGTWGFSYNKAKKSYEPLILSLKEKKIEYFNPIFKECYENYHEISLYSVVFSLLNSR